MNKFKVGRKITFWDGDVGEILSVNGDIIGLKYGKPGKEQLVSKGWSATALLKSGLIIHGCRPTIVIIR